MDEVLIEIIGKGSGTDEPFDELAILRLQQIQVTLRGRVLKIV